MSQVSKRLILLELNEINFDVVEKYLASDPARFPSLQTLLAGARIRTSCEKRYEELEPWIQWVSVHTGMSYSDHGVFRLGDILNSRAPQIFEKLEQAGFRVGVISAMNAENRLENPAYFIPDPWTQTSPDSTWWSRSLSDAISQAVNENAKSRIAARSAFKLAFGMLRFARLRHYKKYISLVKSIRRKPWVKALILDLFLHDVHWSMFRITRPNFSTLFLNAGAHIQHHYLFSAKPLRNDSAYKNPTWYVAEGEDPVVDMLELYDMIVGEYLTLSDTEMLIATGLSQKPYDRHKFYYRLNNHAEFLRGLGIKFSGVLPRMTRDFLIEFDDPQVALAAQKVLASVRVDDDGLPLFGEIDNRGKSLFVTLTYPREITASSCYSVGSTKNLLLPNVSFVAIKNGMHQEEGFAFFTPGFAPYSPAEKAHVSKLGAAIIDYFGVVAP